MELLQITAFIPNRGEVELLDAPTVKDLADGNGPARNGATDRWGAIEAPWAGLLTGTLTPLGTTFRAPWRGHTVEAPTDVAGHGSADGGLMTLLAADSTRATPESLPTTATGVFRNTDFGDHWASRSDVSVEAKLDANTIDLTVTVKNVGDDPEPVGIGWNPRFLVPSDRRNAAELHLPGGETLAIADPVRGIPSGKSTSAGPSVGRFQLHASQLGDESVDVSLVQLKPALMDAGASAELRDPTSGFGLRLTAMSSTIRELHVTSPTGSRYVGLGLQTNFDDPLGKEWIGSETLPIDALLPGQTLDYKIRLEIFAISNHPSNR
jgi:galactose mutarotase-like enzyme